MQKLRFTQIGANEALFKIKEAGYKVEENMDKNKFELILKYLYFITKVYIGLFKFR